MRSRPPRPPVSDLTDHLGYWLRMVSNHVSLGFARRLEDQGVTVAEWVMLRALYDVEALTPSRLAERMGMTRGAISKLADRLLAKGLLTRAGDPADGRTHSLSLSDAGARLVPTLAALADANDADAFGGLAAEDRERLESLLRRIAGTHGMTGSPVE